MSRSVRKLRDCTVGEVETARQVYSVYAAVMKAQGMTLYDPTWSHLSAEKRVAWIEATHEALEIGRVDEGYYENLDNRWPREDLLR